MRCDTDSGLCCVYWHETVRKSVSSFLSETPLPWTATEVRGWHRVAKQTHPPRTAGVGVTYPHRNCVSVNENHRPSTCPSQSVRSSFLLYFPAPELSSERLYLIMWPPRPVIWSAFRTGKWDGSYRCSCHQFELQFIFPVTLKSFIPFKEEVAEGRNDSCEKHLLTSKRKSKS